MFDAATARGSGLVQSISSPHQMSSEIDTMVAKCMPGAALSPVRTSIPEMEFNLTIADVAPRKISLTHHAPGVAKVYLQDKQESPSTRHIGTSETMREASSRSDLHALVVLSLA